MMEGIRRIFTPIGDSFRVGWTSRPWERATLGDGGERILVGERFGVGRFEANASAATEAIAHRLDRVG